MSLLPARTRHTSRLTSPRPAGRSARAESPVVFVGHSYQGAVITYGGIDDRVAALVYIAALGMDETETPAR